MSWIRRSRWNILSGVTFRKLSKHLPNEFQRLVTDLVQKTFERFPWKGIEVAHVLKVPILPKIFIHQLFKNLSESWIFNWVAAGRWLSGRCTASALITSRLSSQQSDHLIIETRENHHIQKRLLSPCITMGRLPSSGLNVLCLLWLPCCPSLEMRIPTSQRDKVRNSNVQLLRRRWYQIVKLLDMHILHFPGTCQYQIWRKETGKHRKIWTDLVGQKEICTCNLDYFSFVMLPMPSNLGIFPLLFLTLSVIRWFAMI